MTDACAMTVALLIKSSRAKNGTLGGVTAAASRFVLWSNNCSRYRQHQMLAATDTGPKQKRTGSPKSVTAIVATCTKLAT